MASSPQTIPCRNKHSITHTHRNTQYPSTSVNMYASPLCISLSLSLSFCLSLSLFCSIYRCTGLSKSKHNIQQQSQYICESYMYVLRQERIPSSLSLSCLHSMYFYIHMSNGLQLVVYGHSLSSTIYKLQCTVCGHSRQSIDYKSIVSSLQSIVQRLQLQSVAYSLQSMSINLQPIASALQHIVHNLQSIVYSLWSLSSLVYSLWSI